MKNTKLFVFAIVMGIAFVLSRNAISQCSGTSLEFDGMDDYLYTPFQNYDFSNFTVECWINVPSYTVNVHYVSLQHYAYIVIGDWADTTSITAWAAGLDPHTIGSSLFDTTDTWYHIAFVYDGTNQYLYINGIIDQVIPTTGTVYFDTTYNSGLVIGARYNQALQYVEGRIDEVRLWNIARSQIEIQNSMNSLLAGNEEGLLAYYQFEDGPGSDTATDITGNGNTLSLNNMDINNVWVNDSPVDLVYNFAESVSICSGDYYIFPDGTLQDSITSQVIHVSNLQTVNSCDSIITTTVNVAPEYDLNEEVTICSGDYYIFPDGTLQHNITSQVIHVSNLVTAYYCDSIITTTLNVDTVDTSVSVDSVTLTANTTGAVYQWIDCNNQNAVIEGETSQSFTPAATGNYAVIITENSCTDTSACYNIVITGINEQGHNSQIIVYPNPAGNTVNLEAGDLYEKIFVELTNINNQLIFQKNFNNGKYLSIDISDLIPGIYFIKVCTEKDIIINKFIKE
jgi:hypothetical protein